jgi:hypothetical protein
MKHRVRFLACDKPLCPARFFTGLGVSPETVLRHNARAAGWREGQGRDYCPNHRAWPGFVAWASDYREAA